MKMKRLISQCMLSSAVVLLAACGDTEGTLSEQSAHLNLNITDAPVDDAVAVVVEFTGVSIKAAEQEEELVFSFDEPQSVDLLALQGSSFASLLDGIELPAGEYNWVRLHVNAELDDVMDSYIELEDGTMKELYIPSGDESGLKIKTAFTLVDGEVSDFTIDFDLRKSLRLKGEDSAATLRPSLRMVNNKHSGHMGGLIDDALLSESCADGEVGAVYVYEGSDAVPADYSGLDTDPVASSLINLTDEGHKYELGFLEKGSYTIAYTCDTALDTPDAVESLVFISTANVELEAHKMGRRDFNSKGGMHSGRSDGRRDSDGGEGRHGAGMSDVEREAKQAEWDALTEEEKAALQAEWALKKANREGERDGMGDMSEGEQTEWDALTEEERAAKQAERETEKAAWEAMTEEEREAARAERKAEKEAEGYAEDEAEDAVVVEDNTAVDA